ncbi:porin family protein [Arsenophonus sp. aPb]|uniref:outer membrane protein n=1 Tax=Arsenophonus sp. aPb TaxID=3041619 RepID=UPI00246901BE|nr:porin family protein [Arsenophonus sp. aPb]WGL98408.1 porin family protein [Arsenophonus sp. aPb]
MKKCLVLFLITGLPATMVNAADQTGLYVTGKIGGSVVQSTKSTGSISAAMNSNNIFDESGKLDNIPSGALGGGIALGYNFKPMFQLPVRVELDFTARSNLKKNGSTGAEIASQPLDIEMKDKIQINTLMVNAIYDLENSSQFTPYVLAGVGVAQNNRTANISADYQNNNVELLSGKKVNYNFAWSIGAGVKYDINSNLALDLSYRYINAGKTKTNGVTNLGPINIKGNLESRLHSHDIMLGMTYLF